MNTNTNTNTNNTRVKLGMKSVSNDAPPAMKDAPPAMKDAPPAMKDNFSSLTKMNDYIREIVENNVFFMFIELLKKIDHDYGDKGLSFNELKERYLSYFKTNMINSNLYSEFLSLNLSSIDLEHINKPPKSNEPVTHPKEIISNEINDKKCYARTSSGTQCSRKKQRDSEFCGSHTHSQPYGRIDQAQTVESQPKRRGRPPSQINKDSESHIEASIETIDDIEYIVDDNTGHIYKKPDRLDKNLNLDQLKLVATKNSEGEITWLPYQ
jgi:hypothetical protein